MSINITEYLSILGQRIATKREAKGLTQYKLAKNLFMEQVNLARIEQGKTNPTVKTLFNTEHKYVINQFR